VRPASTADERCCLVTMEFPTPLAVRQEAGKLGPIAPGGGREPAHALWGGAQPEPPNNSNEGYSNVGVSHSIHSSKSAVPTGWGSILPAAGSVRVRCARMAACNAGTWV
jgi:hypothetical protein